MKWGIRQVFAFPDVVAAFVAVPPARPRARPHTPPPLFQDHSIMLGVEAVDNILIGSPELTLDHPDAANAVKRQEPWFGPPGSLPRAGV
jgi:hypothetical protein